MSGGLIRRSCAGRACPCEGRGTSTHSPTSIIPHLHRTHTAPLPGCGAARAEPSRSASGGGGPRPYDPSRLSSPTNPPKTHPFTLLTPMCLVLSFTRSNTNPINKGGTKHHGETPRPDPEDSTPRPTPKALAQARGSSRRRHILFPWSHGLSPGTQATEDARKAPTPSLHSPSVILAPTPLRYSRVVGNPGVGQGDCIRAGTRANPPRTESPRWRTVSNSARTAGGIPGAPGGKCSASSGQTWNSRRSWGHSPIPGPGERLYTAHGPSVEPLADILSWTSPWITSSARARPAAIPPPCQA